LESETGTENGPLYRAQSSVQLDDEDVVDGCRFLPKFAFEVFCFGFVALAEKTQKAFNFDCVCVCLNVSWDLGQLLLGVEIFSTRYDGRLTKA